MRKREVSIFFFSWNTKFQNLLRNSTNLDFQFHTSTLPASLLLTSLNQQLFYWRRIFQTNIFFFLRLHTNRPKMSKNVIVDVILSIFKLILKKSSFF